MSYRENHTTYHRGKQQEHKLQLVTYLGWNIKRKFKREGVEYINMKFDGDNLLPQLSPIEVSDKEGAILWYTMFGRDTPLPLPFVTDWKKAFQVQHFAPLHKLKQGHHYASWNMNAKDEGESTGEWFWVDYIEVLPSQAREVLTFKKRHHDIDFPHPKKKVISVMEWGYPEGAQIYDYARDFFGDDDLTKAQWLMVTEAYFKDLDTAKARKFKEELAKERLLKSLFGENE